MADKRVRETVVPERIPLREQNKSILSVPVKPGFIRRWVNDDPKQPGIRIDSFLRAGWRIVEDSVQVGTEGVVNQNGSLGTGARKYVGSNTVAVLMEIEEQYYNEDQAAKMAELDRIEAAIYRGEGLSEKTRIGDIKIEDRYTLKK